MSFIKQTNKVLLLNNNIDMESSDIFGKHKWNFSKKIGGKDNAGDVAEKLFLKDYAHLVRESIQNSLDVAINKTDPVKVIFRFGEISLPTDSAFYKLEEWVNGGMRLYSDQTNRTYKNLKNVKECLAEIKRDGVLHYLEVSDENTRGMDYTSVISQQSKTRFYSFAHSEGNSSKSSITSAGSHGVGKIVFYKISKLNTLFVSSKCADDGVELFEGISELCTSLDIDGETKYQSTGYFCLEQNEEPTTERELIPVPFRRTTFGTSVYAMGVTSDSIEQQYGLRAIEKAVLDNFWLSILQNKLIVQIGDKEIKGDEILTLADTVYGNPDLYATNGSIDPRPYIETVAFAENDKKHILIKDNLPELGEVSLYILKDKQGDNYIQYMRETRMLIKKEKQSNYGFYGVFVCDGEIGNINLRNSEDATHTRWNSNGCEDENDRIHARKAIQQMNKFIDAQLVKEFGGGNAGKSDISGAEEFLYMDVAYDELEDTELETIVGRTNGELQKDESSSQTTLFDDIEFGKKKLEQYGHVSIEEQTTATIDENGELFGGKTDTPHIPDPGPVPPPISSDEGKYTEDEEGTEGHFIKPIHIKYRPYFQKEGNVIYHFISLTSNEDCDNATVEIIVTGDEDKDKEMIFIESVSPGVPCENKVTGLPLVKGQKVLLKVKFEDNLLHSLSLKAYEDKR